MDDVYDYVFKEVQERAYDFWEARMQWDIPGDHLSDWLQAQKEILWEYNPKNRYNKL